MCVYMPELTHSRAEHDAMKQQAESTNREYDRLMKEHASLQVCLLVHLYSYTPATYVHKCDVVTGFVLSAGSLNPLTGNNNNNNNNRGFNCG